MSYHPGDEDERTPRGCGCHFEMPGTCPGRHACPMFQPDAPDEPDLTTQIDQWIASADPALRHAIADFIRDQLDVPDLEMLQNWVKVYQEKPDAKR